MVVGSKMSMVVWSVMVFEPVVVGPVFFGPAVVGPVVERICRLVKPWAHHAGVCYVEVWYVAMCQEKAMSQAVATHQHLALCHEVAGQRVAAGLDPVARAVT